MDLYPILYFRVFDNNFYKSFFHNDKKIVNEILLSTNFKYIYNVFCKHLILIRNKEGNYFCIFNACFHYFYYILYGMILYFLMHIDLCSNYKKKISKTKFKKSKYYSI